MKLSLLVTTATCLISKSLGARQKNNTSKKSLNKAEKMSSFSDPLEEYYNSIGNHGEYLTRCPNCGLYSTGYYCSDECEEDHRITFS